MKLLRVAAGVQTAERNAKLRRVCSSNSQLMPVTRQQRSDTVTEQETEQETAEDKAAELSLGDRVSETKQQGPQSS